MRYRLALLLAAIFIAVAFLSPVVAGQDRKFKPFMIISDYGPSNYLVRYYTVFKDRAPDGSVLGNTGLSWDHKNRLLLVAKYNFRHSSSICFFRNGKCVRTLDLSKFLHHIQGIVLDNRNGDLYVWAWPIPVVPSSLYFKGDAEGKSHSRIYRFSKDGRFISSFSVRPKYSYPGAIDIFEAKNELWLKPNRRAFIAVYDLKTKGFLREIDLSANRAGGEGFAIADREKTFFVHTGQKLLRFDLTGNLLSSSESPTEFGYEEGVAYDPETKLVYIGADEYLHGRRRGGNRVWVVNPTGDDNTIHIPKDIMVSSGTLHGSSWTSPVIMLSRGRVAFSTSTNVLYRTVSSPKMSIKRKINKWVSIVEAGPKAKYSAWTAQLPTSKTFQVKYLNCFWD